jgi:hypothetical protein
MLKDLWALAAMSYFILFLCVWAPSIADAFAR